MSSFYLIILMQQLNGMVDCCSGHEHIKQRAMLLVDQVRLSKGSQLMTCLLEGPSGRYGGLWCFPLSTHQFTQTLWRRRFRFMSASSSADTTNYKSNCKKWTKNGRGQSFTYTCNYYLEDFP